MLCCHGGLKRLHHSTLWQLLVRYGCWSWCLHLWPGEDGLVFTGLVRWTEKKTEIELNPTAKDRTTSCSCTNSEIFQLPVATFVEKSKNWKNWSRTVATGLLSHHVLELTHAHFSLIVGLWIIKKVKNWLRYGQKHFYTQLECMSLLCSPYLSQILTELLETLTSLQGIKISIHICNLCEVILLLFGTINFTTKDWSQPVWTSFFSCCGQIVTGI